MQIWMIMMGFEFLLFALAAVMVIVWMKRPDDVYDEMLREIEETEHPQPGLTEKSEAY